MKTLIGLVMCVAVFGQPAFQNVPATSPLLDPIINGKVQYSSGTGVPSGNCRIAGQQLHVATVGGVAKLYVCTGSAWQEAPMADGSGNVGVSGNLTVGGNATIGTTLPAGAPVGSIGASVVYSPNGALNIKGFGAICDGSVHPLSGYYATLAAAQVAYPFVTALTQQRDWAAATAALTQAQSNSGSIYIPGGTCRFGADALSMTAKATIQCDSTIIQSTAVRVIQIDAASGYLDGPKVTGCRLEGGQYGLYLLDSVGSGFIKAGVFSDLMLLGQSVAGIYSDVASTVLENSFYNVLVDSLGETNPQYGGWFAGTAFNANVFVGCRWRGASVFGVYLDNSASAGGPQAGNEFVSNRWEANPGGGMKIVAANNTRISGHFESNGSVTNVADIVVDALSSPIVKTEGTVFTGVTFSTAGAAQSPAYAVSVANQYVTDIVMLAPKIGGAKKVDLTAGSSTSLFLTGNSAIATNVVARNAMTLLLDAANGWYDSTYTNFIRGAQIWTKRTTAPFTCNAAVLDGAIAASQ